MKKIAISLLLIGVAAAAFANESADERQNRATFSGERTRADVRAEYVNARRAGALANTSESASLETQSLKGSVRSRAEVRAEAVQAARDHVIDQLI
ncbi:MAG: DUF4148 domain-containing protein [Ramlibacter sp.]|nr:DUF4148 domain-containing protein [Ramlibacter sp.]